MAQKKITDYQLISAITSTVNFFVDDLTQNYRATAEQIKDFVLSTGNVATSVLADLAVTTAKLANGAVTDAKTSFTPPTQQRFTSGSGTYTTPTGVKYIRVRMVGGGGGGGAATTGNGSQGTSSTFGSSLLIAGFGSGGAAGNGLGASPGSGTINSPAFGTALSGSIGNSSSVNTTQSYNPGSGSGGCTPFGGGGGAVITGVGFPGRANTGGGGAGGSSGGNAGGGGGGAGFVDAIITSPSATYPYTVGTGGAGGVGTGNGGGAGGSGYIEVTEYYQ